MIASPFITYAQSLGTNRTTKREDFAQVAGSEIGVQNFTLMQTKQLILSALNDYPILYSKVEKIFADGFDEAAKVSKTTVYDWNNNGSDVPGRWRLKQVEPGKCAIQSCRPAESKEIKQASVPPGDYYTPGNAKAVAMIDYEFDGTINSVIYLAHELGHAIADDSVRENLRTDLSNPSHLKEIQAYLVQTLVTNHLNHESGIKAAADSYGMEMRSNLQNLAASGKIVGADSRPINFLVASGLAEILKTLDKSGQTELIKKCYGRKRREKHR